MAPTKATKALVALLLAALAAGLLSGCGDSAPSTTLAPDKPAPDTSKMSSAEMDKLLQGNHDAGSRK